ncbi:MAG: anthranilate phosphoribosyltransferase [Planctomycetota bacterium]|nr:MAG: anthranilate phosphoribosyltransferase [Planctomycetota bacterium]
MTKITEYIEIILEGNDLSFEQAKQLLDTIFEGNVADVQVAAFLAAMRAKKASVTEISGLAYSLREHAVGVKVNAAPLVDTCGTGGAALKTFNISTAAAFVAAGAGVFVAKHGNKGITSKCGSADVLTALGVNIAPGPERVAECIEKAHIGFMFAPKFHPAMKHVQPIRQTLDFRTAFNILGPLANPAKADAQVLGVAEESLMPRMIETLKMLDVKRAMVVHSNGLDEISTMGPTKVLHLENAKVRSEEIEPTQYGFPLADFSDLAGGDAQANARIIRNILSGNKMGAKKDIVLFNAAAAIIVSGIAKDFVEGIEKADEAICNGNALNCLDKLVEISNCKTPAQ